MEDCMFETDVNHSTFKTIISISKFYDELSFLTFGRVRLGTKAFLHEDVFYESIAETLKSIYDVLIKGRVNDAYALMRKYYDSVITHLYYILCLKQFMDNPELQRKTEKESCSLEDFVDSRIQKWIEGDFLEEDESFDTKTMLQTIRKSDEFKRINKIINETSLKSIRESCNRHLHYNSFRSYLMNRPSEFSAQSGMQKRFFKIIENVKQELISIFSLHYVLIALLREFTYTSTDYVDYLDCGRTPPENSQYIIAPFVEEAFEILISPHYPELMGILKANTSLIWDHI